MASTSIEIQSEIESEVEKQKKCESLITFLKLVILASYLAEDLIALFWQDRDKFSDQDVFWIFWGFGALSGLMECCGQINKWALLIFVIIIEITQAILFMYICSWDELAVITFSIFIGLQLIFECINCALEESDDADLAMKVSSVSLVFQKCCSSVISGIIFLPYLYYNEDALFRTLWFDIYVTCSLWFSNAAQQIMNEAAMKLAGDGNDYESWKDLPFGWIVFIFVYLFIMFGNMIFSWILGLVYISDAEPGFEYGWTMFIVISGALCICSTCCGMLKAFLGSDETDDKDGQSE